MLPVRAFACVVNLLKPGFTNESSMHGTGQLFFDLFRLGHMYLFKTSCPLGKKEPRPPQ